MEGATPASDIWSLAATVCELVSGHPPYHDLVAMSAMFRIVEDEMPPLPESASPELQMFLRQCFAKDPQQRPSAQALFFNPWLCNHTKSMQQVCTLPVTTELWAALQLWAALRLELTTRLLLDRLSVRKIRSLSSVGTPRTTSFPTPLLADIQ